MTHLQELYDALAAHDAFMAGEPLTGQQRELARSFAQAACYGAAALAASQGLDHGPTAMARAFVQALIDPLHPDLDYLRADRKAGEVARQAQADLLAMIAKGEGK